MPDHVLHYGAGVVERPGQVRIDDFAPGRRVHIVQRAVALDPGIVDQNSDRSEPALDVGDYLFGAREIPRIRLEGDGHVRQALGGRPISGVGERDFVALRGKLLHDGPSDPATASGYQRDAHFGRFLP